MFLITESQCAIAKESYMNQSEASITARVRYSSIRRSVKSVTGCELGLQRCMVISSSVNKGRKPPLKYLPSLPKGLQRMLLDVLQAQRQLIFLSDRLFYDQWTDIL